MKWTSAIATLWCSACVAFPVWAEEGQPAPETGLGAPAPNPEPAPAEEQSLALPAPQEPAEPEGQGNPTPPPAVLEEPAPLPEPDSPAAPGTLTPPPGAQIEEDRPAPEIERPRLAEEAPEAEAGEEENAAEGGASRPERRTLGLSPAVPELPTLPGSFTPPFGAQAAPSKAFRLEFDGMLYVPLRFGIGERENPGPGQKKTVLHAPPRVPGDFETFGYTSTVPNPWTQLNFSYGNDFIKATVIVAARTVSTANGYFNIPDMLGINDAFLTFNFDTERQMKFQLNVGAFSNRYGQMGEYDLGRYGTPLIARVSGTGLTGTGLFGLGRFQLIAEVGFQGQFNKAPVGVEPAGWNGFVDPNVGSSFAGHGHVSLRYQELVEAGLHYLYAFTRDDRASSSEMPDGDIGVAGVDTRWTMGRFGHLYLGFGYTHADQARAVSPVIRVLNAPGGPGLIREYFGPDSGGTGSLFTVGGQYDLSLGNLLRYPTPFDGNGPDVVLSAFVIFSQVVSDDPDYDGVSKVKFGGEMSYSMLRWLALGARYDHVMPDAGSNAASHAILSGRLIFHSGWNSRDQVTLQYSYFINGSGAVVREGYPPVDDPTIVPDAHVLSLTASMLW